MSWQLNVEATVGPLRLEVDLRDATDGGTTVVVGPNGSGKTTLLRLVAGASTPDRGQIIVGEEVFYDASVGTNRALEERQVGYVPQGYGLFPHLRAIDNVCFGLATRGDRRNARRVAEATLDELDCAAVAQRFPSELSGGEQQRVALARALVIEPTMLLLDEPLAALDVTVRRNVRRFLAEQLNQRKHPTILVTHDLRDVAALADHVVVLEAGRVVQEGRLDELHHNPYTEFVRELVEVAG